MTKLNFGNVSDVNRTAISHLKDDIFDVLQALYLSFSADKETLIRLFDIASSGDGVVFG